MANAQGCDMLEHILTIFLKAQRDSQLKSVTPTKVNEACLIQCYHFIYIDRFLGKIPVIISVSHCISSLCYIAL